MKLVTLLDSVSSLSDNSAIKEGREQMNDPVANEILNFAAEHLGYYIEDLSPVQDRSNAQRFGGPAPVRSGVMRVDRNFNSYRGSATYPTVIPVILKIGTAHPNALDLVKEFQQKLISDIDKSFDVERDHKDAFITDHSIVTVSYDYASGFASVQVHVRPR